MIEAYAHQSADSHAASVSIWRERYLTAVKRCLATRNREHIKAAILTAKVYRRIRLTGHMAVSDDETKVGETLRKRLHGMILGNHGPWANFLVADVGLSDTSLGSFKEISPFKGCILLLVRSGTDLVIRGEVGEFRKAFQSGRSVNFTQICNQEFRPHGARKHHYVLQVLRPETLQSSASLVPRAPRMSDPVFLRQSQVGDLFGSLPPSLPPPPAVAVDTIPERPALAPEPPAAA